MKKKLTFISSPYATFFLGGGGDAKEKKLCYKCKRKHRNRHTHTTHAPTLQQASKAAHNDEKVRYPSLEELHSREKEGKGRWGPT